MSKAHFGFHKYFSAFQQDANLVSEAKGFQKRRTKVMAVVQDIEEAYDRVVLYMMKEKMVPSWLVKLTSSCLQDRMFRVLWGNSLSSPRIASDG